MPASAGQLRHQLEVQRVARGRGEAGGVVRSWVTVSTQPGQLEQLSGQELTWARQVDARTTHKVRMRYVPGLALTSEDRLVWKDRDRRAHVLAILSVLDVGGRGTEWEVMAAESSAKGTSA